jgi:hypothetical protein
VAARLDAPFLVLEKTRRGDRDVIVSAPALGGHADRTPVSSTTSSRPAAR